MAESAVARGDATYHDRLESLHVPLTRFDPWPGYKWVLFAFLWWRCRQTGKVELEIPLVFEDWCGAFLLPCDIGCGSCPKCVSTGLANVRFMGAFYVLITDRRTLSGWQCVVPGAKTSPEEPYLNILVREVIKHSTLILFKKSWVGFGSHYQVKRDEPAILAGSYNILFHIDLHVVIAL